MKKLFVFLVSFLLLMLAVGCGGTETAVPTQPNTASQNEPEIQTVAAKPQLIEFYADW